MKRKAFAQGLALALQSRSEEELDVRVISAYDRAAACIEKLQAQLAVIEIPEFSEVKAEDCLDICKAVREGCSCCRLLLMCPESDRRATETTIEARREKKIDGFVYYDASLDYILSMIESLT